jgi:hypothetical protein
MRGKFGGIGKAPLAGRDVMPQASLDKYQRSEPGTV